MSGEDDSDLYLEEREAALQAAQEEKRKVHVAIPGMLNPFEMPVDMQD
jgi:exportin-1